MYRSKQKIEPVAHSVQVRQKGLALEEVISAIVLLKAENVRCIQTAPIRALTSSSSEDCDPAFTHSNQKGLCVRYVHSFGLRISWKG
jgi:hypothetical protein